MTLREATEKVQRTGLYHVNGLSVPVQIMDIRTVWGRLDVRITPVGGAGTAWVSSDTIVFGPQRDSF